MWKILFGGLATRPQTMVAWPQRGSRPDPTRLHYYRGPRPHFCGVCGTEDLVFLSHHVVCLACDLVWCTGDGSAYIELPLSCLPNSEVSRLLTALVGRNPTSDFSKGI